MVIFLVRKKDKDRQEKHSSWLSISLSSVDAINMGFNMETEKETGGEDKFN